MLAVIKNWRFIAIAALVALVGVQHVRAGNLADALQDERIARAEDRVGWDAALQSATAAVATERATVERLRRDLQLERRVVADARADLARLKTETDAQLHELKEVTDAAPPEYQACMAVPVPADVQRLLVYDAGAATEGGDGDASGARDSAAGADGGLRDPAAGLGHDRARRSGAAGSQAAAGAGGLQRTARAPA